jgi:hypothetical protein
MRNPYQRKVASRSTSVLNPQETYDKFIETVIAQGFVVGLFNEGWALCVTPTGQKAFAVWHQKSLAKLLIRDTWENYKVEEISLKNFIEKVIPYLKTDDTAISINLGPEGQNVLVAPKKIILDLKTSLYQLYLDRPDIYQALNIPLPRNIRLNR